MSEVERLAELERLLVEGFRGPYANPRELTYPQFCDVLKDFKEELAAAARKEALEREDRAYVNGFRAGWNAGIAEDTELLANVTERHVRPLIESKEG